VIEIVSDTSRTTDRVQKFREYETGGVPEYWVLDPELERAEFFQLDRSGRYKDIPPSDGIIRSRAMKGLWLKVDWLWTPPPLLVVLKEWGILG
jgi:Uma2 family endonuclease